MGSFISGDREISQAELMARAAKVESGLRSLGIKAGDCIALFLRNDFVFYEVAFACSSMGAYAVAINWHSTAAEARCVLEDSGVTVLVVHADLYDSIGAGIPSGITVFIVPTPPEIRQAFNLGDRKPGLPPGTRHWDEWREQFEAAGAAPIGPPATIIYTSGTTGRPKGVKRNPPTPEQARMFMDIANRIFGFSDRTATAKGIVTAIVGPMYHSAPNAYGLLAGRLGATVVLQPRFNAAGLLALIERYRVTHLHMVPVMFTRLLKLPVDVRRRHDLSSLRHVIHGAAPCPVDVKRAMIEWWGAIVHEYYGSTETAAVTACSSEEWLAHPGTVGRPVPEASVVVLGEDGQELAAGETGDIACALNGIADFTYHRDDQKRRSVDRNGLIALGDVGRFDDGGYLYICDRSIDVVISGGVNIYPAEVEAALLPMPGLVDCAVFGIPDPEFGESVCAVVQRAQGSPISDFDVRAWLADRVAGFKIPRRIDFVEQLPREDSGKIFKRKIRDAYRRSAPSGT